MCLLQGYCYDFKPVWLVNLFYMFSLCSYNSYNCTTLMYWLIWPKWWKASQTFANYIRIFHHKVAAYVIRLLLFLPHTVQSLFIATSLLPHAIQLFFFYNCYLLPHGSCKHCTNAALCFTAATCCHKVAASSLTVATFCCCCMLYSYYLFPHAILLLFVTTRLLLSQFIQFPLFVAKRWLLYAM